MGWPAKGWLGHELAPALGHLSNGAGYPDKAIIHALTWLFRSDTDDAKFWRSRTNSAAALHSGSKPGEPSKFDKILQASGYHTKR